MFDLDVVIVGGGIAGCAAGLFLRREGSYRVSMFERAEEIFPIGAAISVWSNGVKVMNRLGLGKHMVRLGGRMETLVYKNLQGRVTVETDLEQLYRLVGERAYPVARADLQQLLLDEFVAAGGELTLGKTCIGVEENALGKARAKFSDGTFSDYCDVLVGADGIKSCVRSYVLAREVPIVYHYTNWNGIVRMDSKIGRPNEWVMFVGDGKRASVMPIGGDRFYFFFGAPLPPGAPIPGRSEMRTELESLFRGWPSEVQALIQAIDFEKVNRIPICDIDPIPTFSRGSVVLIGDAAHATTPTLGQGGCQALEDAEVLSSF